MNVSAPRTVKLYRMTLQLDEIEPPVWRELELPGDMLLDEVHEVIQQVMPWKNYHLWQFVVPGQNGRQFALPGPLLEHGVESAEETTLQDALAPKKGAQIAYVYDFGDYWIHRLTVKEAREVPADSAAPTLLAGERAAPPEDCGGVDGYYEILAELAEAGTSEDHDAELLEWLGDWRPDQFEFEAVKQEFNGSWIRADTESSPDLDSGLPPETTGPLTGDAQQVAELIRRRLSSLGYHSDNVQWAVDVWHAYYERVTPRIAKQETWIAVMEYLAAWFVGKPQVTQPQVAATHGISAATVAAQSLKVRKTLDLRPAFAAPYGFVQMFFGDEPHKFSYREMIAKRPRR